VGETEIIKPVEVTWSSETKKKKRDSKQGKWGEEKEELKKDMNRGNRARSLCGNQVPRKLLLCEKSP